MLTYSHCLDTDELWFWFWESTWTVLSYCLKNGRLLPISSVIISAAYRSMMSSWRQVMSKHCCWVIWHDPWPLAKYQVHYWVQNPVQSPESCTLLVFSSLTFAKVAFHLFGSYSQLTCKGQGRECGSGTKYVLLVLYCTGFQGNTAATFFSDYLQTWTTLKTFGLLVFFHDGYVFFSAKTLILVSTWSWVMRTVKLFGEVNWRCHVCTE